MFTIQCTTCNAKLAVKNESIIGQIVACPKCGSMVLIQPPEESLPIPNPFSGSGESGNGESGNGEEQEVPRPTVRFPDVMTFRSPADAFRQDFDETEEESKELEVVPESELRTRKILLGILAGFVIVVLAAAAVLLLLQRQDGKNIDVPKVDVQNVDVPSVDVPSSDVQNDVQSSGQQVAEQTPPVVETETRAEAEMEKEAVEAETEKEAAVEAAPLTITVSPSTNGAGEKDKLAELLAKPLLEEPKKDDVVSGIQSKMPNLLKDNTELTLDIPALLGIPLKKWTLNQTPLLNVLRQFSELTEIPLTLDIDELLCRSISVDTPITINYEDGTAGDFLKQILQTQNLIFTVEENQITITVPETERNKIIGQNFDVSDISAVLPAESIADYIRQLVIFFDDTSDNTFIKIENNSITVNHTKKYMEMILRLLEQLRVLRGLKQITEIPPEKLVPESFGWDAVCVPMTLNYYRNEPLADILRQIEKTAKVRILADNRTLHRSLVSLKTLTASIHCNREPVNTALQRMLSSVDEAELNYRIVSADILEVSAADELSKPEKMTIEIHRFETEEKKLSETPEELVRTLKTAVAPETWATAENPNGGVIVIDKPTGCLFVRQSQAVQRELRLLLEGRTKNPAI